MPKIGHGRHEQVPEDRVGCDEQSAEERQQGQADRDSACDRSCLAPAHVRSDSLPWHVLLEQVDRAREGRSSRRGRTDDVVAHLRVDEVGLRPAQCAERDGARDGEKVRGKEERRVVPGEQTCEQEKRRGHRATALVQRDPSEPEQEAQRRDEGEREDPGVDAERVSLEEVVAESAQRDRAQKHSERDAFATYHARKGYPDTRSSGAYSSISRRSEPSSKRTVTTPSASIRITMPVPSVEWRTVSPVETSGTTARGATSDGRVPYPVHEAGASRSRSTPWSGSSSRNRDGRLASLRP